MLRPSSTIHGRANCKPEKYLEISSTIVAVCLETSSSIVAVCRLSILQILIFVYRYEYGSLCGRGTGTRTAWGVSCLSTCLPLHHHNHKKIALFILVRVGNLALLKSQFHSWCHVPLRLPRPVYVHRLSFPPHVQLHFNYANPF